MQVAVESKPRRFAKVQNLCKACGLHIKIGSEIWPMEKNIVTGKGLGGNNISESCELSRISIYSKAKYTWVHITCAKKIMGQRTLKPPVCPYYAKHNRCGFGSTCFYSHNLHFIENLANRSKPIKNQASEVEDEGLQSAKAHGNSKGCKSGHFRRFLVDNYGVDFLRQGSG